MGSQDLATIEYKARNKMADFFPSVSRVFTHNIKINEEALKKGEIPYEVIGMGFFKENKQYAIGKKLCRFEGDTYDNSYQKKDNIHIVTIKEDEHTNDNFLKTIYEFVQAHNNPETMFHLDDYLTDEKTEYVRHFIRNYINTINEKNEILRRTIPLFRKHRPY